MIPSSRSSAITVLHPRPSWMSVYTKGEMLTFTSATLEDPLTVVGPVDAVLYASTNAPDTDWVVRLCDVDPGEVIPRVSATAFFAALSIFGGR